MQNKQLNIIFGVLITILVFLQARSMVSPKSKQSPAATAEIVPQPEQTAPEEPAVLSIEDIRNRPNFEEMNKTESKPASLSEIYVAHPKEDTGNNIVESWARVNPEEKAKVSEELDKQVEQAKEELKVNPDNKSAKHMLFIAETMKKLCKSNFDYRLLESVPEDEGGLKKKGK
jgi:hypothetical protein